MKKVKILDFKNCSLLHYFQSQRWLFLMVNKTPFYVTRPDQVPEKRINVVSVYGKCSNLKQTRHKREHVYGSNENYTQIEVMGDTMENCKLLICFPSTFRIVSIGPKGIMSGKDCSFEKYFKKFDYRDSYFGNDGGERVSKVLLHQNIQLIFIYNHRNIKHEVSINGFMPRLSYDSGITNSALIECQTNIKETFHIKYIKFNSLGIMQLQYSSLSVE